MAQTKQREPIVRDSDNLVTLRSPSLSGPTLSQHCCSAAPIVPPTPAPLFCSLICDPRLASLAPPVLRNPSALSFGWTLRHSHWKLWFSLSGGWNVLCNKKVLRNLLLKWLFYLQDEAGGCSRGAEAGAAPWIGSIWKNEKFSNNHFDFSTV